MQFSTLFVCSTVAYTCCSDWVHKAVAWLYWMLLLPCLLAWHVSIPLQSWVHVYSNTLSACTCNLGQHHQGSEAPTMKYEAHEIQQDWYSVYMYLQCCDDGDEVLDKIADKQSLLVCCVKHWTIEWSQLYQTLASVVEHILLISDGSVLRILTVTIIVVLYMYTCIVCTCTNIQ